MNKLDVEKRLKELSNCKYINFHFNNGHLYSCPPQNITVYLDNEYIDALNQPIYFQNISYIDSYY